MHCYGEIGQKITFKCSWFINAGTNVCTYVRTVYLKEQRAISPLSNERLLGVPPQLHQFPAKESLPTGKVSSRCILSLFIN